MRGGWSQGLFASVTIAVVSLLILSAIPSQGQAYTPTRAGTRQAGLDLIVGGQDEMKIRNLLPARANDVWTSDVLFRIYDSVGQPHPSEDRPMAWIAKGVDFDEDGVFESTEYDKWAEKPNADTPLRIVVYYDFSGVRWHDGKQMTPWDLLFSYHVSAMNPRFNTDLRVLFPPNPDPTKEPTYEPARQLNIQPFDADGDPTNGFQRTWDGESGMFGGVNSPLRMAVQFDLTATFALFYESTIFPIMLPMHLWSRTGGGRHTDTSVPPDGPDDYGCAIWLPQSEADARGIPECGSADPSRWGHGVGSTEIVPGSRPFNYLGAEGWVLTDQDVIGHGPFKSLQWTPNVEAKVVRNDDFYTGIDATTGQVYDDRLSKILNKPTITGIRFKVYTTTQVGVFALQDGQIDFYHWNVGADFVGELLKVPEIAVQAAAEPGFFYMAYNLRKAPWGYERNNPSQDIGFPLRQALARVIDKRQIVQNLLQNYGVIGYGLISPANTRWYNDNIDKPGYDLARANAILDDLATPGGDYYDPRFSLDPQGVCDRSNPGGCRSLPEIGRASFDILTPQADYDPVRASAGALIADRMRQVGINAQSKPTAFQEIVASVNDRNFDMYILGWRIGGTDPDYLFSFFHSSNAGAGGQNNPGFNNATFDQVISASRAELDRGIRKTLIDRAQVILAEQRPYDVLYYRTNIEGYRQDRFVGWQSESGTIWNFWSLQRLHPPSANALQVSTTSVSAMASAKTEPIVVKVLDSNGQALADAKVNLTVDSGNLTIGANTRRSVNDTTDLNGEVTAIYASDSVDSETPVLVTAIIDARPTYDVLQRTTRIRVFPAGVSFLSLTLELPTGDRVTAGSDLPLRMTVRDQDRALIRDAEVSITVDPPGELTPNPHNGTAEQMASVILSANPSIDTERRYTVNITATLSGYVTAEDGRQTTVVPVGGNTKLCANGSRVPVNDPCPNVSTPGLDVLPILAGIGIAALVSGVVVRRNRRS